MDGVCRMGDIYMKDRGLSDLTELARAAVVDKATSVLREDPGAGLPYIVLDLPCSFFSLRTLR